jgi:isoprenylcysteine carboxyl methyltransferase (ICMT) family protein YpbQ
MELSDAMEKNHQLHHLNHYATPGPLHNYIKEFRKYEMGATFSFILCLSHLIKMLYIILELQLMDGQTPPSLYVLMHTMYINLPLLPTNIHHLKPSWTSDINVSPRSLPPQESFHHFVLHSMNIFH